MKNLGFFPLRNLTIKVTIRIGADIVVADIQATLPKVHGVLKLFVLCIT